MTRKHIEKFWTIMRKIRCIDKDEGRMTASRVSMSAADKNLVILLMDNRFIPMLRRSLDEVPFETLSEQDQKNFFSHVIAKGEVFFNGILENPIISLYLLNNFYPIYTWLSAPNLS